MGWGTTDMGSWDLATSNVNQLQPSLNSSRGSHSSQLDTIVEPLIKMDICTFGVLEALGNFLNLKKSVCQPQWTKFS